MIIISIFYFSGSNLVRVRAQVMMRDDSTGGWVPMGGGGLSNVSVRKRFLSHNSEENKPEYLIYGKKISDGTVSFLSYHFNHIILLNLLIFYFHYCNCFIL